MTTRTRGSRGHELADRLAQGVRTAARALLPGARHQPVLYGVTPRGDSLVPLENILVQSTSVLVDSGRVFTFGDSTVLEIEAQDGSGRRLVPLRTGGTVEPKARSWLANLLLFAHNELQFPPPPQIVDVLLRAEPTVGALPRIQAYARLPVFDRDFQLCDPGWHPDVGVLVHGPVIEPVPYEPPEGGAPALDRLPPHLREVLAGFCFAGAADLVNAVAILLTGLLVNHFITEAKPLLLLDGNQPGVGKTLLARTVGMVLGGTDPRLVHYTAEEEELQKRICATLRESQQSILLIDNARVKGGGPVESAVIEANSMAPEIALRILGRSENYTRPNDVIWAITMNSTRTSPDIVSRGLPIRLAYEGDPRDRTFPAGDPVVYAREHRIEILGELAGLVVRWTQAGRPAGNCAHRCGAWARVIGGILQAAGLPEFLTNYGEAAVAFNTQLDALAALAEAALGAGVAVEFEDLDQEGG